MNKPERGEKPWKTLEFSQGKGRKEKEWWEMSGHPTHVYAHV
jgi:hypothetical protein